MHWELHIEPVEDPGDAARDGRFVAHRHDDALGPHVDLRVEHGDFLMGWRVDGTALVAGAWATEKGPHPLAWLASGGDRIDAGSYRWEERTATRRVLLLDGRDGCRRVRFEARADLTPVETRALAECLAETGTPASAAPALLRDGLEARSRAVARLCGLGVELDGTAFDAAAWRRMLGGLPLDEIHGHLRAFESRFDAKYPPEPVSQPEPLPDATDTREPRAWGILRDTPA
jgi:hypothetical protein